MSISIHPFLPLLRVSAFGAQGELDLLWTLWPPWQWWAEGLDLDHSTSNLTTLLFPTGHLLRLQKMGTEEKEGQGRSKAALFTLPFWPHEASKSLGDHSQRTETLWLIRPSVTGEEPGNRNRILALLLIAPVIFSKGLHCSVSVSSFVDIIISSYEVTNERLLT